MICLFVAAQSQMTRTQHGWSGPHFLDWCSTENLVILSRRLRSPFMPAKYAASSGVGNSASRYVDVGDVVLACHCSNLRYFR